MSDLRVITEPTVRIVGRNVPDVEAIDEWLAACGASWAGGEGTGGEVLAEFAGRACYWSFERPRPGGTAAYFGRILGEGHGSVLEHAAWTVAIAGVSRSLTHELIRHRHLSPSQLSQRYYDESEAAFVVPPAMIGPVRTALHYRTLRPMLIPTAIEDAGLEWLAMADYGRLIYARQVDRLDALMAVESEACGDRTLRRKRAREAARSVLPNAVETRVVLTGNARAWRNVVEQRGSIHADLEVRRLAVVLARLFKGESPHLFADIEVFDDADGRESVRSANPKV